MFKSVLMKKLFASGLCLLILGFYVLIAQKAKDIFEYLGWNNIPVSIVLFVLGTILVILSLSRGR
jgi:hypothetical protein